MIISSFDGFHLGHRTLLESAFELSRNVSAVVLCDQSSSVLMCVPSRVARLKALGIEQVSVVDRSAAFEGSRIDEVPWASLEDHGRLMTLSPCGAVDGCASSELTGGATAGVDTVLLVERPVVRGAVAASCEIRRRLSEGDVVFATALLGRRYSLDGRVIVGKRLGRALGFPTANMLPRPGYATPRHGVYSAVVRVGETRSFAAVNIGVRPTVGDDRGPVLEAHLLDFERDIYGEEISVEFVERLRDEVRFDGLDELRRQLRRDVAAVRRSFRRTGIA